MQKLEMKKAKDSEGELTEYAKKLLAEARATPLSEYIPHEEVKRRLLKK